MKRLRQILGSVLGVILAIAPLQAVSELQLAGRDFNHLTTGFPLSGGHAMAACETCHAGGVFKGTPRNCDGCHAPGRRVLATPKSTTHIVTDAPCENCHFNTATFQGARFNHGVAKPGQCSTCHNGRSATGKPRSHNTGNNATASCDQCHRTVAWFPASWNHVGVVPGTCANCHNGSLAIGKPGSHTTIAMATYQCDECHGFTGWLPAKYKHNAPALCSSCHNNAIATGKPASHGPASMKGMDPCEECHRVLSWLPASYTHTASGACATCHDGIKATGKSAGHVATGTSDCGECHFSKITWAGAIGAKPATHVPYAGSVACSTCHVGATVLSGSALHAQLGNIACYTCHGRNTVYPGNGQETASWPNFHKSSKNPAATDCSASGCHRPAGTRGVLYLNWD